MSAAHADRVISVLDGPECKVREFGTGETVCILIHGFGEGSYVWDGFIPSIADHVMVLAIDLRGHGDSGWDAQGRYDLGSYLRDCQALIASVPQRRLILVGHSLGADVAIHLASNFPDRTVGLGVIDFGPEIQPEARALVRADFAASLRDYASEDEYVSWLEDRRALPALELLRYFATRALRQDPGGAFRLKCDPALLASEEDWNSIATSGLWRTLRTIGCPALVVRGAGSAVLSRDVAERMAATLRNGTVRVVPAAGHSVMADNPADFAAIVRPAIIGWASAPSG